MAEDSVICRVPLSRIFFPGQIIVVDRICSKDDADPRDGSWESRVIGVSQSRLAVSTPAKDGAPIAFPEGASVNAYVNKNGVRYSFEATVTRHSSPSPFVMGLVAITDLRKTDRRETVRTDLAIRPGFFAIESDPARSAFGMSPVVDDISSGGFRLSCLQKIEAGSRVRVTLDLPKIFGRIQVVGEVVRVHDPVRDITGALRWRMGVVFTEISQNDRNRVAAFALLAQQRRA